MAIVTGSVRFLKRIQVAEYHPEEAEVSLTFEGTEEDAKEIGKQARSYVFDMLAIEDKTANAVKKATVGRPPRAAAAVKIEEVKLTETKPADTSLDLEEEVAKPAAIVPIIPAADLALEDDLGLEGPIETKPAKTYTDIELSAEIQGHNKTLREAGVNKAAEIKQLVHKFSSNGFAAGIPQDKREEFLAEVKAIK